ARLYRRNGLENAPHATQMTAHHKSLFGVADFCSRSFATQGHPAAEIHANNLWLQAAWAREHGMAVEIAAPFATTSGTIPSAWLLRSVAPFKPMRRPLARKIGLSPKL